jgi:predicted amidohydrolase
MLKAAEIILVPNACTLDENRIGQLRARAFENMVGIAVTNYAAPQYNGHSVAFDGMAYEKDGQSRMTLLVQADEKEGVYLAEFDIETLREYRKREVWGNAFRKPGSYHILTSNVVKEPFIRKTERK